MPIDPEDPKVQWAVLGKQVEDFLRSDVGDYLLKCARNQEEQALAKLKRVKPWRILKIMRLQNEIRVAESIQAWLGDAIASGQAALEQLNEESQ